MISKPLAQDLWFIWLSTLHSWSCQILLRKAFSRANFKLYIKIPMGSSSEWTSYTTYKKMLSSSPSWNKSSITLEAKMRVSLLGEACSSSNQPSKKALVNAWESIGMVADLKASSFRRRTSINKEGLVATMNSFWGIPRSKFSIKWELKARSNQIK